MHLGGALMLVAMAVSANDLVPIGQLGAAVSEASGIAASRRHPGVFWVHNDSGNAPFLFAVRRDGTLINRYRVAALNIDWEEIALGDDDHLLLGDTGNNGNLLPLRVIHELDEPDPTKPAETPLQVLRSTFYRFHPGARFDCEAFYRDGPNIVLIAKRPDGAEAALYVIPLDPPAPMLRPAVPRPIGTLPGFIEPATGASLSHDGRRLAVCSTSVTRVYERASERGWVPIGQARYNADQVEAVTWAGPNGDLVLASEQRGLYLLNEQTWRSNRVEPLRR